MVQILHIHREQPQLRLLRLAIDKLQKGGIIVYPTDSAYALGCKIGDKTAMERICRFRQLGKQHNLTLVCRDLSELATYAQVDNVIYRLMRSHIPGPYTFVLLGTKEVPRRLLNEKRKTIGFRVPENIIAQALLAELQEPLMSATLILPGENLPVSDPEEVSDQLTKHVDIILHGGACGFEPTTVIDCTDSNDLKILRVGKGDIAGMV